VKKKNEGSLFYLKVILVALEILWLQIVCAFPDIPAESVIIFEYTEVSQNIRLVVMTALKPSHFYLLLCFSWAPLRCVLQSQGLFLPNLCGQNG